MPFIISLHGLDIRVALARKRWLVKMILSRAKAIVVNSENTMRQLDELSLDKSKIVLIYPNVELKKADPEITKKVISDLNPNNKLVILTVGRLVPRKGHHLVMQALSRMDTANIKYIAVGDGPELENLRRLRNELKLEGKVKFAINVSDEELPSYYEMADIFALPNILTSDDAEGFGIVFLEAASFGLPIIAGRNGGVMEILSDKTARLVNTDDYQQVKTALEQLVASPAEREQLSKEARKVVHKFSDFNESISKLKAIL